MQWHRVWSFSTPQLTVALSVAPEDMDPADSFDDEEDIENIRNGTTEWFCAKMSVYLHGHEIASDYLGGCAYYSVSDFYTDHRKYKSSDYFTDMVGEVVSQARAQLAKLQTIKLRQEH